MLVWLSVHCWVYFRRFCYQFELKTSAAQILRPHDGVTAILSSDLGWWHADDFIAYKRNCVLSNTGLSNAPTKTGICTSLKSDFYFRFHSPLSTKSALLNFICTLDLVLICWQMWSPEPDNCRNWNMHTSKIGKLLLVCLTNNRPRSDLISEPHAKFGENL